MAAEAFCRLNRVFSRKGVTLIMSGVNTEGQGGLSLRAVDGSIKEVRMLGGLNSALESCDNDLLKSFYASKEI